MGPTRLLQLNVVGGGLGWVDAQQKVLDRHELFGRKSRNSFDQPFTDVVKMRFHVGTEAVAS